MIKVVFLARLRDALGVATEMVPTAQTVDALVAALRARGGVFAVELAEGKAFKVAVNHALAKSDTPLKAGDEVAFLPPVTGG
jgi:molybdopterin synthase sulfur carrier subunit